MHQAYILSFEDSLEGSIRNNWGYTERGRAIWHVATDFHGLCTMHISQHLFPNPPFRAVLLSIFSSCHGMLLILLLTGVAPYGMSSPAPVVKGIYMLSQKFSSPVCIEPGI
jgi:hypothetical protein